MAVATATPSVESQIRARVESELASELARRDRTRLRVDDQLWVYELVGRVVGEEQQLTAGREDSEQLWRRIFAAVTPLGPLAEHLADPDVEEVRINGTESCFVFKAGRRYEVEPPFADEDALVDLVHWYTDGTPGARLDRASPTVTMTLPEGSRLHAALSPPARPMSVTIRRHPPSRFRDLAALADSGFLPRELIAFLEAAVAGRLNILIAGGAGAGKTTFMRVLARLVPPEERVVTIEDQAELHLWRELRDCISLEGRPPNTEGRGAISIQMLVHEALRMSPDRIIIGEVRGGEALDLLDA
jgi:pilus assembly protein CpaF